MSRRMLILYHVFPPIPFRGFDWMVYDEEEAEDPRVVGWGKTQWEALNDYADGLREFIDEQEQSKPVPENQGKT